MLTACVRNGSEEERKEEEGGNKMDGRTVLAS